MPVPPISAMTTSIVGSSSTWRASGTSTPRPSLTPRSRCVSMSATRTRSSPTPSFSRSIARLRCSSLTTPVPMVPKPMRPMRMAFMPTDPPFRPARRSAGGGVRPTGAARVRGEGFADAAERLARAVLVLDQGKAPPAIAVLAEADAGRHGHLGLVQQEGRELEGAHVLEGLRNWRPDEHRRPRLRDRPAGAVHAVDQHVAPPFVAPADIVDAL